MLQSSCHFHNCHLYCIICSFFFFVLTHKPGLRWRFVLPIKTEVVWGHLPFNWVENLSYNLKLSEFFTKEKGIYNFAPSLTSKYFPPFVEKGNDFKQLCVTQTMFQSSDCQLQFCFRSQKWTTSLQIWWMSINKIYILCPNLIYRNKHFYAY